MEVIIKGTAKEIADLVVQVQGRQNDQPSVITAPAIQMTEAFRSAIHGTDAKDSMT